MICLRSSVRGAISLCGFCSKVEAWVRAGWGVRVMAITYSRRSALRAGSLSLMMAVGMMGRGQTPLQTQSPDSSPAAVAGPSPAADKSEGDAADDLDNCRVHR